MAYMFGGTSLWAGAMKVISGRVSPGTLTFTMGTWASSGYNVAAVISGVSANTHGNYQFLLTLRNYIYVYVFGEKMGDIIVSGIAGFPCDSWSLGTHGLTDQIGYYNNFRLGSTGTPVAISFAGWATWGFLVGGQFQYMNPKSRLAQFQFKFKTLPQ